jgi:hypothetical protein
MRRIFSLILILLLALTFALSAQPAKAAGSGTLSVDGYTLTCSYFQAAGLSSGSSVWIEAVWYAPGHGVELVNVPVFNGHFNGSVSFPSQPTGTWFELWVWGADGGWYSYPVQCPTSTAVGGPPLPAGFVLKTITCDVAVFDAPGGQPVDSNAIKSGQTWYVNPTPVEDAAGRSWTEIFVAGYTNGFVPTDCVH